MISKINCTEKLLSFKNCCRLKMKTSGKKKTEGWICSAKRSKKRIRIVRRLISRNFSFFKCKEIKKGKNWPQSLFSISRNLPGVKAAQLLRPQIISSVEGCRTALSSEMFHLSNLTLWCFWWDQFAFICRCKHVYYEFIFVNMVSF